MLRYLSLIILFLVAMPLQFAEAADPAPFKATYSVSYRGIKAGLIHFELRDEGGGKYVYESQAEPGFVARLIVSRKAVERSTMRIDADGVRPLSWFLDDGKPGHEDDGELVFAWDQRRVGGIVEGKRVEFPTEPGMQDRLSYQVAAMTALLRGQEPGTILMLDKDRIKPYSYSRREPARIKTQGGEFETVIFESTRAGSSRLSRIWHAPSLGYIAVRFERLNKGKVETVLELVSVER